MGSEGEGVVHRFEGFKGNEEVGGDSGRMRIEPSCLSRRAGCAVTNGAGVATAIRITVFYVFPVLVTLYKGYDEITTAEKKERGHVICTRVSSLPQQHHLVPRTSHFLTLFLSFSRFHVSLFTFYFLLCRLVRRVGGGISRLDFIRFDVLASARFAYESHHHHHHHHHSPTPPPEV